MTTTTLLDALLNTDMLEIDELHAWQFDLDEEQLQQHAAGSSSASETPLLSIECMDGRNLRKWKFSLAQVLAAQYDADSDSWLIAGADAQHRIKCFEAFSGDNNDQPDDEDAGES
ncbi:DUF5629 family protein [Pseudomonas sp. TTU2014-080ASC]|uniref:DUF5629 family protein n=1 Tax=Pseudomonas sp. TTU2014-080ASC TaxID=1729724 RepID=UPI000718A8AA|nr:DUF5629 family protein [Pseudomonas sp. TTU2014-080ASC]KRW57539.1 hypothetical protein AO726_20150 [Pseudomonas sp. TTU2014-080ASC]